MSSRLLTLITAAALALTAAPAQARDWTPAPPIVHVVYGEIPADLNGGGLSTGGDGSMIGAYADVDAATIHLQADPNPFARAHETGHLFDDQVLTAGDRLYFQREFGLPPGPWDHGKAYGDVDGLNSPNEWFADYYAGAATGMTPQNGYGVASFAKISAKRMKRFQSAIERVGARHGLKAYRSHR